MRNADLSGVEAGTSLLAGHGDMINGMGSSSRHAADNHDLIRVQGARENNLKNVTVQLPKRRITVLTGVSESGKSSLVFGTIAAESAFALVRLHTHREHA